MRIESGSSGGLAVGEADSRYFRLNASSTGYIRGYTDGTLGYAYPAARFDHNWIDGGAHKALVVDVTNTSSAAESRLVSANYNTLEKFYVGREGNIGVNMASLSASLPAVDLALTWNNAGHDFTAFKVNVTNTASGSGSKLADFQVGGSSKAFIDKAGKAVFSNWIYLDGIGSSAYFGWVGGAILTDRRFSTPGLDCSQYLDITEMSAPAAPAANTARLYVEDNGSGKTRLMVLFPTGAAQVLATEP